MFQNIMSLIISFVCLAGGLFMFTFGLSNVGTQYFSLGPTLLGLVLVVHNVFVLYVTFSKKSGQDTQRTSVPATRTPPKQTPATQTPVTQAPATRTPGKQTQDTSVSDTQAFQIPQTESTSVVHRIFSHMNQTAIDTSFYGSEAYAEAIAAELVPMFAPSASLNDYKAVDEALLFYSDVWIRKHFGPSPELMTTSHIKGDLTEKYRDHDAKVVAAAVDRCVAFIYQKEPNLEQRDVVQAFQQNLVQSNAGQNANAETAHLDDADYGLVPQKPVFVAGFPGTHTYLDSLCLSDGTRPTFNRTGSMNVPGIEGPVDAYEVTAGGKSVGRIFVCLYGSSNSTRAPRGFVLR